MKLINKLPSFYYECEEVKVIQNAFDEEKKVLENNFLFFINQLFIETANDLGVSKWEELLDLNNNSIYSLNERKSIILSKLKSRQVITIEAIKNIAESFNHGDVDVIEDYNNYKVLVRFINTTGTPSNIESLKNAIREVLPAHLSLEFDYLFNKWFDFYSNRWSSLSNLTWGDIRTKTLDENTKIVIEDGKKLQNEESKDLIIN